MIGLLIEAWCWLRTGHRDMQWSSGERFGVCKGCGRLVIRG